MTIATPVRHLVDLIVEYSHIDIQSGRFEPVHNVIRLIEVSDLVGGEPGIISLPGTYKAQRDNSAVMISLLSGGKLYRQKVLTNGYLLSPTGKFAAYIEDTDGTKKVFSIDNGMHKAIVSREFLYMYTTDVVEQRNIADIHMFGIML